MGRTLLFAAALLLGIVAAAGDASAQCCFVVGQPPLGTEVCIL